MLPAMVSSGFDVRSHAYSGYCLSQVPKLVHVDVVGGWMPDFEPTMDRHYIRLEDDWKASLTLSPG